MQNKVQQVIMERRSVRKYQTTPVPEELVQAVLEAGLWAPTARNMQEIHITVLRDPEQRKAFRSDFAAADGRPQFQDFDYHAPVFFFLYGPKDFPYTEMDSGIVAENMAIAAQSLGLGTVMIGCIRDFMRSEAGAGWREKLRIGEDQLFTLGLCLGYPEGESKAPARKADRVWEGV